MNTNVIKFACPHCQRHIEAPFDLAGATVGCPECAGQIIVPQLASIKATQEDTKAPVTKSCPFCGKQVLAVAKKCKHCRSFIDNEQSVISTQTEPLGIASSRRTLVIAGGILAALIIVGGIAIGMLVSKGGTSGGATNVQPTDSAASQLSVQTTARETEQRRMQQEREASRIADEAKKRYDELKAEEARKADEPRLLGGEWGEQAGRFALEVAAKGKKGYEMVDYDSLKRIWNLYYRDTYCPTAELAKEFDDRYAEGIPWKEEWEKQSEYDHRVADAKARAKEDWNQLKNTTVIGVWGKTGDIFSDGGSFAYSECFKYDPEAEVVQIAENVSSEIGKIIDNTRYTKRLELQLENPPRVQLQQAKAKTLSERRKRLGMRVRYLTLAGITAFDKANLTAHLVEFVVLDATDHVLLYWHETPNQSSKTDVSAKAADEAAQWGQFRCAFSNGTVLAMEYPPGGRNTQVSQDRYQFAIPAKEEGGTSMILVTCTSHPRTPRLPIAVFIGRRSETLSAQYGKVTRGVVFPRKCGGEAATIEWQMANADHQQVICKEVFVPAGSNLCKVCFEYPTANAESCEKTVTLITDRLTLASDTNAASSTQTTPAVTNASGADAKAVIPNEAASLDGHRYMVVSFKGAWETAKKNCEDAGGHLAIIRSELQNKFLADLAHGRTLYIGMTDKGHDRQYLWVDGTEPKYTNWAPGQPDNMRGQFEDKQHYVLMLGFKDGVAGANTKKERQGMWDDQFSSNPKWFTAVGYICEWDK